MSDTSQQQIRLGVAGRVAGLSAALLLVLAACGEPATEGEQQQGSVMPQSEQTTDLTATQGAGDATTPQTNTQ
jgi:hypothetical protein